jgi:NitT/TauT family transport system permease protein
VVAFLLVIEAVSRSGLLDSRYLPPASTILGKAAALVADTGFLADVWSTVSAWALALIVAAVIGIPLGTLMASYRMAYLMTAPMVNALRPVPTVVLIPLAVLVLGAGLQMKVALTTFTIIWPILFNTMFGVRDVDPVARETARAFKLPKVASIVRVVLPSAAPFIMTGLRIAASMGLIVIVGSELFGGAQSGIGAFIYAQSLGAADLSTVIAGALWAGILGVLINIGVGAVDKRYFSWARRGALTI